ncbi:hypothetical protein Pfo_013537 [Paulownia fortunei]|nr:hypothetical protein Pfo_013537 [Paulownia fortunei]
MGANFCGFRRRPNPNRSSMQDLENENCGLTASVMKFMKPRSLWAAMKVKKRQFHRQEKQELELYCKNNCKVLTLEDWIISSPGFSQSNYINISVGEMPAPKQSSRKIHPSSDGDPKEEFLPKSGESLSVEISVKTDEAENGQAQSGNTSFCRTKSGKMKKKLQDSGLEVT